MKKSGSFEEHFEQFPKSTQALLKKMRQTIRKVAPKAEEKISYGIPTYALNGNLVHFAGYKGHIGFYPGSAGVGEFSKDIAKYKHNKGSIQFPLDQPLPVALITRIVKFRVKQNMAKAKKSPGKPSMFSGGAKKKAGKKTSVKKAGAK